MANGILDIAETYLKRGWQPVEIPYKSKAPRGDGWQTTTMTLADLKRYFGDGKPHNIGVILGKPSGGLVDIDLDCPEAIALAPFFLPPTDAKFGRASRRNSHWIYTSDLYDTETTAVIRNQNPLRHKDASGKNIQVTIAELRTGGGGSGAQTVFPGSVHETGEAIDWEPQRNGTPAQIDGATLKKRFGELCAAALLAHNYPGQGSRHDMALALGGILASDGWTEQEIKDFVKPVARSAGDGREENNRAAAAAAAIQSLKDNRAVYGWPKFRDIVGERVADKFSEWSGISTAKAAPTAGQLARGKSGALISNLDNAMTMIAADPDLANLVREDLMLHQAILQHPVPGRIGGGPLPHPLTDDDVVAIQRILQARGLAKLAKATVDDALSLCASEDAFHPLKDYLDARGWDGTARLPTWLHVYLGADDTPYTREVGLRFLLSMVARIYKPGCQADYMLILEGPQGILKSTACRVLGDRWFSGTLPDITNTKEARQHLLGVWLGEIPELHAMRKADVTQLKSFLTDPVDRFRRSYGRRDVDYPRQCVFVGTTNETGYLRDQTGNRRFWPVPCGDIDIDALIRDRDQLFGEAAFRFHAGEPWWPDRIVEAQIIQPEQESRRAVDAWEKPIADYLNQTTATKVTIPEIAQAIDPDHLPIARLGTIETRRITTVLTAEGWVSSRTEKGRFWIKK